MELVDKQLKLEADLEKFRKQRDAITVKIKAARRAADEFKEEHGNVVHQARGAAEWEAKQPAFIEARKDPEWQKWRTEFMAKRKAEDEKLSSGASIQTGMKQGEVFFIHKDIPKKDKELFFGPLDGSEEFVVFDDTWQLAHVLVHVGIFPSLSQARKNGADGPISEGFTILVRGKKVKRREMVILNKF